MARATFGGGIADFVTQSIGGGIVKFAPATLKFYTARTGGTQITDLLISGSPAATISVGTDGQVPQFQGPDSVYVMWADAGAGRVQIVAIADAIAGAGAGAGSGAVTLTDNNDGTASVTASSAAITDNNDGTALIAV